MKTTKNTKSTVNFSNIDVTENVAYLNEHSFNAKLHGAEVNALALIGVFGAEHFPNVNANVRTFAMRFGKVNGTKRFRFDTLQSGTVCTFDYSLSSMPYSFVSILCEAFASAETALASGKAPKASSTKATEAILEAIGKSAGFTYNTDKKRVFLKKRSNAERLAKRLVKELGIFHLPEAHEKESLRNIEKALQGGVMADTVPAKAGTKAGTKAPKAFDAEAEAKKLVKRLGSTDAVKLAEELLRIAAQVAKVEAEAEAKAEPVAA